MSEQRTDAAERSAHVTRGVNVAAVWPCVEIAPGMWRLRALVEAEARIAALKSALDAAAVGLASIERHAYRRGAEAMREAAAGVALAPVHALTYGGCRTAYEQTAERIRALPVPEGGE